MPRLEGLLRVIDTHNLLRSSSEPEIKADRGQIRMQVKVTGRDNRNLPGERGLSKQQDLRQVPCLKLIPRALPARHRSLLEMHSKLLVFRALLLQ